MTVERCPCCQQPITTHLIRVCYDCKKPISHHDKWTYQPRGNEQIHTMVHRNCDEPTAYVPDLAHPAVKAMRKNK